MRFTLSDEWLEQPYHLRLRRANNLPPRDAVADIIAYHDRTKHQPERYGNVPGGLDWATQPLTFRRFSGAPWLGLPLAGPDDTPPAAILSDAANVAPRLFTIVTVSLFFEHGFVCLGSLQNPQLIIVALHCGS